MLRGGRPRGQCRGRSWGRRGRGAPGCLADGAGPATLWLFGASLAWCGDRQAGSCRGRAGDGPRPEGERGAPRGQTRLPMSCWAGPRPRCQRGLRVELRSLLPRCPLRLLARGVMGVGGSSLPGGSPSPGPGTWGAADGHFLHDPGLAPSSTEGSSASRTGGPGLLRSLSPWEALSTGAWGLPAVWTELIGLIGSPGLRTAAAGTGRALQRTQVVLSVVGLLPRLWADGPRAERPLGVVTPPSLWDGWPAANG